ncbi:Serine/threonine-protein kinase PknB [Aureliella helgolandensis]|uniref:non-specific serine/threonine protein kinase n=2 Tax=Aureliella helgolandensis TaxID=2527968 RepID=A0A518G3H1_9BACT|nr:Serine/threonine-protein kinase PknB [Aureliella helgolandensis]
MEVERALAEYMQKSDAGELTDRESFLALHPTLRSQLAELLEAADWIERLAGPTFLEQPPTREVPASDHGPGNAKQAPEVTQASAEQEETLPLHNFWAAGIPSLPAESDHHRDAERQTLPGKGKSADFSVNDQPATGGARPQPLLFDTQNPPRPAATGPLQIELAQPKLPCQFGDYVLERVLGCGGMGVVYFGRQTRLDRPVAIKTIRSGALASQEEVLRFYAEARSAARLDHPCIVTVHQCGEHEGHRYFSMDYVAGSDLSKMLNEGRIDCKRAARYVRDAARAIQYAHDRGVVHRDLKPANVLVDENDAVRITDFGLAKTIDNEAGLTATGATLGTPSYMSPEQAAGNQDEQNHATDIYSLGAVLYTIVTGSPPFKAANVMQTMFQVIHRPAPKASNVADGVDDEIATIIDVCLQKSPERRYRSAAALADDLDRYLQGLPIHARPLSRVRRAWYWLLGVPIVGAILDNRVVEPTDAHRWVQRGLISVAMLMLAASMLWVIPSSVWFKNRIPSKVAVASGAAGGSYEQLATVISDMLVNSTKTQTRIVPSAGSSDNLGKLERGEVDLAILQADAVDSGAIAVVAPLYFEVVHVLVRADSDLTKLSEFGHHRIAVGDQMAGSQSVAKLLLQHAGVNLADVELDESQWQHLASELPQEQLQCDAAIVVSRVGGSEIKYFLNSGFRFLPISNAWQFALDEPSFRPYIVSAEHYPDRQISADGVATVATPAYLAARDDAPAALVQAVLRSLFTPEVVAQTGIFSANHAAHWQGIAWHPAAREFFGPYRGSIPVKEPLR